jgi:hypothetical protein
VVERGPEKAGVGGSIPSLATISFDNLTGAMNELFSLPERLANCVASSGNVLSSEFGVACGHLDIRVAEDLRRLFQGTLPVIDGIKETAARAAR